MPEVARKTRRGAGLLAFLLFLVLLGSGAAGLLRWIEEQMQPVRPGSAEEVVLEIPAGASTREIATLLAEEGLINDPVFFRYYARYLGLDVQLQPGEYRLSPAMSPEEILRKLAAGEVVVYRFTVPEGLTIEEMADVLAEQGVVDRDRFLEVAAASDLADKYLPEGISLRQPLEGYLFPATYEYRRGIAEEDVIRMMFDAFERLWTPEWRARAEEMGLTIHEVVTLASIIEEEAQVAAERPIISGVYHNRLKIGMKLDADPTVAYALGKPPGEPLLYADLEVDSPYNTYRNPGLPPGPISAPGKAAIEAALFPAEHDYWYFVAKADGTGEHYFAEALAEQNQNIQRARQNAAQNE